MLNFDKIKSKLSELSETTINAIKEGRCLVYDEEVKGYTDMAELKKALGVRE